MRAIRHSPRRGRMQTRKEREKEGQGKHESRPSSAPPASCPAFDDGPPGEGDVGDVAGQEGHVEDEAQHEPRLGDALGAPPAPARPCLSEGGPAGGCRSGRFDLWPRGRAGYSQETSLREVWKIGLLRENKQ